MTTVTIEEAQSRLPVLIAELKPGEEVLIVQHNQPVARLVGEERKARKRRQAGFAKGVLAIIEEDEEHLKDFEE